MTGLKLTMETLLLQLNMKIKTFCKTHSLLNSLRNSGISSAAFLALRVYIMLMMHNTPACAYLLPIRVEGSTMVADKALVPGLMINVQKSVLISSRR